MGQATEHTDRTISLIEVHATIHDGERVIEKSATGPDMSSLRREAAVLAQIRSRRVIGMVEFRDGPERCVLVTRDAGSRTLAIPSKLTVNEIHRALIDLIDGISELHAKGWSHQRISADHVVVGARGRIKLCSLSQAKPLSNSAEHSAIDVAGVISVLDQIAGDPVTGLDRVERRARSRLAKALMSITSDASSLLDAGELPQDVLDQMRGRLSQFALSKSPRAPSGITLPRAGAGIAAVCTVVALTVAVLGVATSQASAQRRLRSETVASPERAPAVAAVTPPRKREPVATRSGPVVTAGGLIYSVGQAGDVATAFDANCDESAKVLVLRPSTGVIYVFDQWARKGTPSVAREVTRIPNATGFVATTNRCDRPQVRLIDGSTTPLPGDPASPDPRLLSTVDGAPTPMVGDTTERPT